MNESLEFKRSIDGIRIVEFSEFRVAHGSLEEVSFRCQVKNIASFCSDSIFCMEKHDFEILSKGLKGMYETGLSEFIINPISGDLIINIKLLVGGKVEIRFELNNSDFTGKLLFYLVSDLTFIPAQLVQLEQILEL